jgi:hypothetical protein
VIRLHSSFYDLRDNLLLGQVRDLISGTDFQFHKMAAIVSWSRYDSVTDLAGSEFWKACGDSGPGGASNGSRVGGCCPQNLTEDYYWRHPHEYPQHPPTLRVQPVTDNNADIDAARFYHQAMVDHGGTSTYFAAGGSAHTVSPAAFGVMASWIENLLGSQH